MKKKEETKKFNTGKFLECIYPFLNLPLTKADYFNSVLRVFLEDAMPDYEIDKASVSRLTSHEYDISRRVKVYIINSGDDLENAFMKKLLIGATSTKETISRRVYDEMKDSGGDDSVGANLAFAAFDEGEFGRFLLLSFKCAVANGNLPPKTKAKTGRSKKGSLHSVFYLSEEEKEYEKECFKTKLLRSSKKLTVDDFNLMVELIAYARLSFSDEEKKAVSLRFLRYWPKANRGNLVEDFLWKLECCHKTYGRNDGFLGWEEPVKEAAAQIVLFPLPAAYRKAIRQNTFADINRVLDDISRDEYAISSLELKELLVKNEFFLPSFDGHITQSLWHYCLTMARLAKRVGLSKEFHSLLTEIEKRSPRTTTMADRINTLRSAVEKS